MNTQLLTNLRQQANTVGLTADGYKQLAALEAEAHDAQAPVRTAKPLVVTPTVKSSVSSPASVRDDTAGERRPVRHIHIVLPRSGG